MRKCNSFMKDRNRRLLTNIFTSQFFKVMCPSYTRCKM